MMSKPSRDADPEFLRAVACIRDTFRAIAPHLIQLRHRGVDPRSVLPGHLQQFAPMLGAIAEGRLVVDGSVEFEEAIRLAISSGRVGG